MSTDDTRSTVGYFKADGIALSYGVELITPELATEWLQSSEKNRKAMLSHIAMLVRILLGGQWVLNGETIKFDEEGRLIDGQHRLMAIIKSGVAAYALVVRGVPPEAATTIDTGRPRTLKSLLEFEGETDAGTLASALRYLWYIKAKRVSSFTNPSARPSNTDLLAFYEVHAESVRHWIGKFRRSQEAKLLGLSSLLAACSAAWSVENGDVCEEFFDELTGEAPALKGHPAAQLRTYLLKRRTEKNFKPPLTALYNAIAKALSYRISGKTVTLFKIDKREPSIYPEIPDATEESS